MAVVDAVAEATGREPIELETLYDALDPDALDALCGSTGDRSTNPDLTVEFAFAGHDVTVSRSGVVTVVPHSPAPSTE